MSYREAPALTKHALDSILPFEMMTYEPKQFTKTREFYKPEQFIWNNPHRASDKMYKFHHKYHDKYLSQKEPIIKALQQKDRESEQLDRIKRLSSIKNVTRERFYSRQKDREDLEVLSGTRRTRNHAASEYIPSASKRFSTISHYHPKPSKYEPMIPAHVPSKIPIKRSQTLQKIEQTYLTGIEQSEMKKKQVEKMIVQETHKFQNKIRLEFEKQKKTNEQKMSRITKVVDKSMKCNQEQSVASLLGNSQF